MRLPEVSITSYRRITFAAVVIFAAVIVTGAAVRLTGSGLGCPDWPTCERSTVVSPGQYHSAVESLNRVFTVVATLGVAALGIVGARRLGRRDLAWLSAGLVLSVLGQAVLGGLVVIFDLAPGLVMAHFLLSIVILADAVVLHHRAGEPAGKARATVPRDLLAFRALLVAGAALVIVLGTVVTSAGPHGGDPEVPRFDVSLHRISQLHGGAVMVFVALVLVVLWRLHRAGAPQAALRAGRVLLGVVVAQAAVGYTQYFTGVPEVLVAVHIAGAAAVWVATLRLALTFSTRRPAGVADRRVLAHA